MSLAKLQRRLPEESALLLRRCKHKQTRNLASQNPSMNPAVLRLEMPLTPHDALVLKQPLGRLIIDADINEQTILTELERAKLVISVGDRSTARLVSFQIIPDISVIDYKERRMKIADDDHCDSSIM